ncbi:hypothetical protein Val02_52420 [Virgisporangium aliadipatigenens]|uniref:Uncharacterized protein n=1 Tax=Virgisporangium aliadipatigenens TaxID=741659 RepID=A0A8J4DSN6_9ACTN|nr:hypothetical protein [Virgisporangium aliadipatigenens]GIJ48356.1 hypothetical protein Val02_52420 [Virgisporangium aliadipatigenens]
MSGQIGVIVLAPAVVPVALLAAGAGTAGYALGKLADVAIERERRIREARIEQARATDRYRALRDQVERARRQFGDAIGALPEAPADGLNAWVDAAERRLAAELGAARSHKIMAAVRRAVTELAAPTPAEDLEESLRRVLARLDPAAADADTRQLEAWAAQALTAPSPATARRLLDDLRHSVDTVNRAVARRRDRLAGLAARLREQTGPLIDAALALLETAGEAPDRATPDWAALEATVDDAIARTREAAVRDYTAWALRESLREIGVESEEDFAVLLAADGMAHVRHPGREDVAVRVRHRPEDGALHFNLVAPHGDDVAPDPEAERQWCAAFDALVPALAERHIEVRVTHRREDVEAQRVGVFPFERRQRSRRTAPRERKRER